jgi:hypothetical protein
MECHNKECAIDYSGASRLKLTIPSGTTKVELTYNGSGRVTVVTEKTTDVIDQLEIDCVGSAKVDLRHLAAKKAKVKYRGSADLLLNVKDTAVIKNGGSGDIEVEGGAKLEVTGYGSGKVNPS